MQKMMGGTAEPVEIKEFGELWQDRVKESLKHSECNKSNRALIPLLKAYGTFSQRMFAEA